MVNIYKKLKYIILIQNFQSKWVKAERLGEGYYAHEGSNLIGG